MKLAEFRGGMASLEASPATGLSQKALVGRIVTRKEQERVGRSDESGHF